MLSDVIGWSVLVMNIIGSTLIATNVGYNALGYTFFLISGIISTKLLFQSNAHKSLLVTQLYFIVINIVGIIRYGL